MLLGPYMGWTSVNLTEERATLMMIDEQVELRDVKLNLLVYERETTIRVSLVFKLPNIFENHNCGKDIASFQCSNFKWLDASPS